MQKVKSHSRTRKGSNKKSRVRSHSRKSNKNFVDLNEMRDKSWNSAEAGNITMQKTYGKNIYNNQTARGE